MATQTSEFNAQMDARAGDRRYEAGGRRAPRGRTLAPTRWLLAAFSVVAAIALPRTAKAADVGDESSPLSVQVHAFASQGALITTKNNYIVPASSKGSFQLSEVGINFTKSLTEKLRVGVQVFAQDFGWAGNYTVQADWFYVDYRFANWLGLRAGRLKIPFGLSNEVNDIDAARLPILLPQSVYPLQNRQFLFAQTGFEGYGYVRAEGAGGLEYRLYGGTIYLDPGVLIPPGTQYTLQFNVPYVVGGRLMWETPIDGLRFGGSLQALELDTTATGLPMPLPPSGTLTDKAYLWVASAEYTLGDAVLTAEYGRWHSKQESSIPGQANTTESERLYAMFTYRVAPWFQPGAYYSLFFPNVDDRGGNMPPPPPPTTPTCIKTACWQHDVSVTARFDITSNWLVKLEGHFMDGTAGLMNSLQVGTAAQGTTRDWGVFLLKTTGYF